MPGSFRRLTAAAVARRSVDAPPAFAGLLANSRNGGTGTPPQLGGESLVISEVHLNRTAGNGIALYQLSMHMAAAEGGER